MSGYNDRVSARDALLSLAPDLVAAIDALGHFEPPVGGGSSARLDRSTIHRALEAFARGDLSSTLLERWAETVHSADDIVVDSADQDFLTEALFELSTPELFGSMEDIVAGLRDRSQRTADG